MLLRFAYLLAIYLGQISREVSNVSVYIGIIGIIICINITEITFSQSLNNITVSFDIRAN